MAGRDGFVNLHTHSEYSLLDGFGHIQEYVNRAIELNQSSLGLTDHGNLYGIFSFIKACQKSGIKPIPGIEAYFAPQNPKGARCHERILYGRPGQESLDVASRGAYLHQTLFALNNEGMRNLYSLVRESSLEGNDYSHLPLEKGEGNFYQKPRMDFDMLARWHDGIIATTGCPSGEIQTRFRLGQDDEAYDYARRMMELFPDRYFVEVMNHNMPNSTVESSVIMKLVEMSEKLHLPLLATNDAHYCRKEDASHHEEMLCLNSGASMSDTIYDNGGKRFAFSGDEYYLKSEAEIRSALPSDKFPNAVENTLMLADMVEDIHFEMEDDLRPVVEIPEGKTEVDVFKEKIKAGFIKKRLESGDDEERIEASKKEIAHEMPVFTENNFVQYMLVVADYINWAKEHGIGVGPARGSAGGSEIANLLGITDIDPIRHDLMFERFLNPERLSPPDVDTDFAATRRDEVLDYVKTKYGEDHICNIVTFGRFLSKTAISTMAKIYDIPLPEANAAKELIPDAANGKAASFSECYDPSSQYYAQAVEFRERMSRPEWKKAFAAARAIEGRVKQVGVHACGVIMSSHPITDAAPFTYAHNPKKPWGSSCSQWTYEELESIGLIKMDFLSLSDLDIVKEALDNISHTHDGQVPDMKKLVHGKMDDEKTYAMLGKGDTLGIFQMSSTGMASLFKRMKPDSFEDIMASIALYRPGPMGMDAHIKYADRKNGTEPDIVLDPHFTDTPVEEILASTHQLLVYQEEVMRISMQVAGFSLGEADGLRKAMGHKKMDVMAEMKPKFIDGAIERGYDRDAIIKLWNYMEEFGKYGFNACVAPDSLITIEGEGKIKAKELWRRCQQGEKFRVLSMNADGSMSYHDMKSITKQNDRMVTYTIRTQSGLHCDITGNHRLLTTHGYGTIDEGTLNVGDELMIDKLWRSRIKESTKQTRRHNALIAARSENGVKTSREWFTAYQSGLTYEDRCAHQQAIQKQHPHRNDKGMKAAQDKVAWLRANDQGWINKWSEACEQSLKEKGHKGFGKPTALSDGRLCDSIVEAAAGEYLLDRGISFELHRPLDVVVDNMEHRKYCDFYANGVYFEMDGLHRGEQWFKDNKYGDDIPFVYMTPFDYKDKIDEALMTYHISNGDPIVSIEYTKVLQSGVPLKQTVYDIEMSDNAPSNYILQGIVSHNSHSAAYGIISYETAYLKAHYPTEFMAAYLSDKIRNAKKPDDVKVVIREAREIGLKMSAIDVNESGLTMSAVKKISPSDPDIVYGFAGIGGVSTKVAQQIIDARDANGGSFSSVDDFMRALPPSLAGKKVIIDGIAGAGGFDRFGVSRRSVVACVEEMADYYKSETKNAAMGKQSLFDMLDDSDDDSSDDDFNESFTVPDMREWDWLTKLEQEGNRIGNAVSGHPMSNVGNGLRFLKAGYSVLQDEYGIPKTVDELLSVKIGSHEYNGRRFYDDVPVRVIASVPLFKTGVNRRGSKFISGQIESPSASMSFRVNGQDMENLVTDNIIQNHVYLITGNLTIDWNGNHSLSPRIFEEVELDHDGRIPIWLHVGEKVVSSTRSKGYMKLMEVLDAHPGDIPVMLHVKDDNGFLSVYDTEKGVEFSRELASQLEHLVGMKRFGRWPRE